MAKRLKTNIPGIGFIFKPKYKDRHGVAKESSNWSIRLSDGTQQTTGQSDQEAAYSELLKFAGRQASGTLVKVRGTVSELLDMAIQNAKARGNRSFSDKKRKIELLHEAFGSIRITDFRAHHVEAWLKRPKMGRPGQKTPPTDGLSDASKNRYMAELRRAFKLGTKTDPPLCTRVPELPRFEEDNVRQGILEEADYKHLRDAFTVEHARLFFVIAYHLGMRSGEILRIRWDQVDLEKRVIRLEKKQTKGKTARVAPIYGDMVGYLEMAKQTRVPACNRVIQFKGRAVDDIKRSWKTACAAAGVSVIPHDMRRTAVTRMIDAGIPDAQVMAIVGHKTNSMLRRYMISSESVAQRVGQKMEAWSMERAEPTERKGLPS